MIKFFKSRLLIVPIMLAMIALFGVAIMLLWNVLMPEIFGLPALNYWQAAGLLLFARILLGGLGLGNGFTRRGPGEPFSRHGNRLREKWFNMTEDERKEFMEKERGFHNFHNRFHYFFNEEEGQMEKQNKEKGNE